MSCAGRPGGPGAGPACGAAPEDVPDAGPGAVHDLVALRIAQALKTRTRYRYVTPQVRREAAGWVVHSPNCSRHVDPAGGPIAIAWLEPQGSRWALHARQHRVQQWLLMGEGLTLAEALDQLSQDPLGRFWP